MAGLCWQLLVVPTTWVFTPCQGMEVQQREEVWGTGDLAQEGVMLFTLGLLQADDLLPALIVEQSIFTQLVWMDNNCWI